MPGEVTISYRESWMGYNGTQTDEVPLVLSRSSKFYDVKKVNKNDYTHRQHLITDVKERLYLIKKELKLIPAEELAAQQEIKRQWQEDVARQRHRELMRSIKKLEREENEERVTITCEMEGNAAECLCAVREATNAFNEVLRYKEREQEEKERNRLACLAQQQQQQHKAEEEYAAADNVRDANSRRVFDEETAILESCVRDYNEFGAAVDTLSRGVRMLLYATNNCYISYLDGSKHTTVYNLDEYNNHHRAPIDRQLQAINHLNSDTTATALQQEQQQQHQQINNNNDVLSSEEVVSVDHDSFDTSKFHQYVETYTALRIQLQSIRVQHSASSVSSSLTSQLFSSERQRASAMSITNTEEELVSELKRTMAEFQQYREKYNARAAQNATKITNALMQFASRLNVNPTTTY